MDLNELKKAEKKITYQKIVDELKNEYSYIYEDLAPGNDEEISEETLQKIYDYNEATPYFHNNPQRSTKKFIILSLLTFGLYSLVEECRMFAELKSVKETDLCNYLCALDMENSAKTTMEYTFMLFTSLFTLNLYGLYWSHKFCKSIKEELIHNKIDYNFSPFTFWFYCILLCPTIIGPFYYRAKQIKAMNLLNRDYYRKVFDVMIDEIAQEKLKELNPEEYKMNFELDEARAVEYTQDRGTSGAKQGIKLKRIKPIK